MAINPIKESTTLTFNELLTRDRTSLMGCAMIAIMLFHEYFIPQYTVTHFFRLYGHWGVEMFLLISGFGIAHSLSKNNTRRYYGNRAKRLIPSCLIAGLCKYFLGLAGFIEIKTQSFLLLVTNIYLWYIYAIVVYYAMAPLIYRLLKRYSTLALLAICLASVLCRFIPLESHPEYLVNKLAWVNARLPIFVLGMYLALKPLKINLRTLFLAGLPFLAVSMALIILRKLGHVWNLPFDYLLMLPATLSICIVGHESIRLINRLKCGAVLEFFGKYSLELYLWHEFVYWNIDEHYFFKELSMPVKFLTGVVVSILLAYLTHVIEQRLMGQLTGTSTSK